jgi:hypothetical protein
MKGERPDLDQRQPPTNRLPTALRRNAGRANNTSAIARERRGREP